MYIERAESLLPFQGRSVSCFHGQVKIDAKAILADLRDLIAWAEAEGAAREGVESGDIERAKRHAGLLSEEDGKKSDDDGKKSDDDGKKSDADGKKSDADGKKSDGKPDAAAEKVSNANVIDLDDEDDGDGDDDVVVVGTLADGEKKGKRSASSLSDESSPASKKRK